MEKSTLKNADFSGIIKKHPSKNIKTNLFYYFCKKKKRFVSQGKPASSVNTK